jgi:nucleoside 2-deoxyribosyltransferase
LKHFAAMRVYVAGRFADAERLDNLAKSLTDDHGCTITHNWMTFQCEDKAEHAVVCAEKDVQGVKTADVVFMVMDHATYAYRGTFTELGIAVALDKTIIMVTSDQCACSQNVFWHLPQIIKVSTIENGIKRLLLAKRFLELACPKSQHE